MPTSRAGTTATVRDIVDGLLEFQGVVMQGEGEAEMKRVAVLISTAVQAGAAGSEQW